LSSGRSAAWADAANVAMTAITVTQNFFMIHIVSWWRNGATLAGSAVF
jgi:hypothetical protein